MEFLEDDFIDPEELADGKVLLYLKNRFRSNTIRENVIPMLGCLRDSVVFVPLKESPRGTLPGRRPQPDLLAAPDGGRFLPVFSQREQIPPDYAESFVIAPMNAMDCLSLAHAEENVLGLVLDAFTEQVILPFEIADAMEDFPSRLRPQAERTPASGS